MTPKEAICTYCANGKHCEWWCKGKNFELSKTVRDALENAVNCEELIDQIEGTTWYHIENGVLVEGTSSYGGTLLYKVEDILQIVEPYTDIEDELYGKTEEADFEKQSADGCEGCKYIHKDEYEMPCLICKRNKIDKWTEDNE